MKKVIKIFLGLSFPVYLFLLMVFLFLKSKGYWVDMSLIEYIKSSTNIVPFKTIITYINAIFDGSMNMDIPIKNLIGNFVMFMPMGIYLPLFINKLNKIVIYSIFMTILLFSIEVAQLVTRRGSFDIDDFILNMLGALIGYLFWKSKVVQKLVKQKSEYPLPVQ
ncbi:VanZ family protein [Neobacillus drentensis]|uniref:VanZ family protein n=1 Tax=Neobacillus drentensis TaxID=220684 RepID=UPI002863F129|nr:VanZ family protein [Neobacillus drentensis]MDR7238153.1 glycopeptide antibiotics resistance protein [Neobacillus drentensis]